MDFTIELYNYLLENLISCGFSFQTFQDFCEAPEKKVIILRHDVDLRPQNSLATAQIEQELGIRGSYFFRIVKESNNPDIIKKIADLGHEVGYHYETMDTASQRLKYRGKRLKDYEFQLLLDKAYEEFCINLEYFRKLYPVKTICMHGSPLSKYDNRALWEKYDYKKLGIIGEPYFDLDFHDVFYLTDTGRRWDGDKVSVRDKITIQKNKDLVFRRTKDIIKIVKEGSFPSRAMITIHPQRWTDNYFDWSKELIAQNLKNVAKYFLVFIRK